MNTGEQDRLISSEKPAPYSNPHRDLFIFGLAIFLWGIGDSAFSFIQPVYLQQMGAGPVRIGIIFGIFGAMVALTPIPGGILSDRFGRRPLIWIGFFIGVIGLWIVGQAHSLNSYTIGISIYGLSFFLNSPMFSYATTARGSWSAARAITFLSGMFNLGVFIGPNLGGFIGRQYGFPVVYRLAAGFMTLAALVVLFIRSQPLDKHIPKISGGRPVFQPRFVLFLITVLIANFALYLPQPLTPNYLVYYRNLPINTVGFVVSLAGLGTALINFTFGRMNPRIGFAFAQLSVAAFAFLIWKGGGLAWFMLGYLMLGGFKTMRSLAAAQSRQHAEAGNMGLYFGINDAAGAIGMLLAPVMAGFLYRANPALMYLVGIIVIGVSVLVSVWGFSFKPGCRERLLPVLDNHIGLD